MFMNNIVVLCIQMIRENFLFILNYVKIQYWDTLPPLSLKSNIMYNKIYVKTLCVLFYALVLVDINLITLFARLVMCSYFFPLLFIFKSFLTSIFCDKDTLTCLCVECLVNQNQIWISML